MICTVRYSTSFCGVPDCYWGYKYLYKAKGTPFGPSFCGLQSQQKMQNIVCSLALKEKLIIIYVFFYHIRSSGTVNTILDKRS